MRARLQIRLAAALAALAAASVVGAPARAQEKKGLLR